MLDLPSSDAQILKRALEWSPKIYTNGWLVEPSIDLVAQGLKPFTSQCPKRGLQKLAKKHKTLIRPVYLNQEIVDYFIYTATTKDFADLAEKNIHGTFPRDLAAYYFIFGVSLGYPLDNVKNFTITHAPHCKSIPEIIQICKDYAPLNASICEVPFASGINQF